MKLGSLADKIDGQLIGDSDLEIRSIATLSDAVAGDISFLSDRKFAHQIDATGAGAIIVSVDYNQPCAKALVLVKDVNAAIEKLLELFVPAGDSPEPGIHKSATIASTAELADNVAIGPNVVIEAGAVIGSGTKISAGCFIGRNVSIGDNCFIWPNVVIKYNSEIGNNVIINANTTIGTDGFGFRLVDGKHKRITHIGSVLIEDNVEIGANCAIDRAKFGKTIIGAGTKIDNFVMIAHNVKIGQNCILVGQVGIAGSTELGNYVVLAGNAGAADHVKIGDGAMLGACSVAISDVAAGAKLMGIPARDFRDYFKEVASLKKLPQLQKDFRILRKQMDKSAKAENNSTAS
ncbi:MAG: UDP-3-O-(3-hydroxymyristoyl)glucosamine N-acyltransferase [Phycisphaerae bacterium]|nr:UDP-3-O-(3-hydroxymyristoyl)glucosamine N-acyltransferase [Phycisphaerae bacterium]